MECDGAATAKSRGKVQNQHCGHARRLVFGLVQYQLVNRFDFAHKSLKIQGIPPFDGGDQPIEIS